MFMAEDRKIVNSKTLTFSGHHTHTQGKCNPQVSQTLRGETKMYGFYWLHGDISGYIGVRNFATNIQGKFTFLGCAQGKFTFLGCAQGKFTFLGCAHI